MTERTSIEGVILGTAAYMSPSRREAERSIDEAISGRSAVLCLSC